MKYYLCQTPEGPQYARNQIEAKKLDPNAVTEEVDTDKDAIMLRLNEMMREIHILKSGNAPRVADIGENPASEILMETVKTARSSKAVGPAEERMNRSWDQVGIEDFIFNVPADEAYRLDNLETAITTRRGEIEE